mmetsp:Transcript_13196/g.31051  ORF Transcript_13196/g.31051 Transcript_13196/m.31051 type:complete len:136 (-) Transcript_13196:223-630(-)
MQRPPPPPPRTVSQWPPKPPKQPVNREAEIAEILRRKQHGIPLGTALLRSRMVWVYTSMFVIPTAIVFMLVGGKTELSKEDLMKTPSWERLKHGKLAYANPADRTERENQINEVLFNTKGSMRHEWARKKDEAKA